MFRRRRIASLALVAIFGALGQHRASAHAGLRLSDPLDGATLGDTPTFVRLSFSEKPETSLSDIRVLDTGGAAYQIGRPEPVADDPLSLSVRVRPLDRGVYIVSWRIVSASDGHATAGAYAFGVRTTPTSTAAAASTTSVPASPFEMLARWFLIVGLVALVGAASAAVAGFGGTSAFTLGAGGWLLATLGLVLLVDAQRRNAAASITSLLKTPVGQALIWRAVAIGAAGVALVVTHWGAQGAKCARPWVRRVATTVVALAALAAMAVHVAAGHAAAGGRRLPAAATVGAQWAHFSAVGIWLGGLAALLLGVRGAPSAAKAAAVRRFSSIAAVGLIVVAATGAVRTVGELSSWGELISTGYGRAVLGKIALFATIALFGAVNRWRSVPSAASNLRPLRWAGSGELALAAGALAAAAVLGTLPPPAAALAPVGLIVSGTDFGTDVRVRLTTPSDQPGPNRFVVRVVDYDTNAPVRAQRVSLRFTALDDPGVAPTSLLLAPGSDDSYVGSGANLAFDGRWRVTVLIERAADSVEVPMDVETRSLPQLVSILRAPGQAPTYTVEVKGTGHVRISPDPERAGRSKVYVACFNGIFEDQPIEEIVLTAAAGEGPARQLPMRRLDVSRFVADVDLLPGRNRIAAVARAVDGARMRATVDLNVPGG